MRVATGGDRGGDGRQETHPGTADAQKYPVREYIGAMLLEMADMAHWDGDDALAESLRNVAEQARLPGDGR